MWNLNNLLFASLPNVVVIVGEAIISELPVPEAVPPQLPEYHPLIVPEPPDTLNIIFPGSL